MSVIEACTSKLGPRAEEIIAMLGLQHPESPQWSSCCGQQEGKDTANATLTIHCDPFSKWDTNAALGGWQMALRRSHSQCFKRRVLKSTITTGRSHGEFVGDSTFPRCGSDWSDPIVSPETYQDSILSDKRSIPLITTLVYPGVTLACSWRARSNFTTLVH